MFAHPLPVDNVIGLVRRHDEGDHPGGSIASRRSIADSGASETASGSMGATVSSATLQVSRISPTVTSLAEF